MKIILYMAPTANGMIAKENDDTSFVSKTEWKEFCRMVKKVGNLVIGRRTYEIMWKNGESARIGKAKVLVISRKTRKLGNVTGVTCFDSPQKAINFLNKQGFKEAIVAGGGKLNSAFMKAGLVDEIYLDIEPIVFGRGIKLFADENFEARLQLVGIKKLSPSEVQLHYKVNK